MKSLILVLLFFVVFSCNRNFQGEKQPIVNIAISKDSCSTFQYSRYLKNPVFIALETTTNSLIGEISKVEITDNFIFILDKHVTKGLFLFAKDGKFIRKIGSQGKGPQEYIAIEDFYFDSKKEQVQILDNQTTQIKTYDIEGNYIREVKTNEYSVYGFTPLSKNDEYIFFGVSGNYLSIYRDNTISKKLLPKSKNEDTFYFYPSNHMFSVHQEEILSYVPFSPIVYQVKDYDINPCYFFDFGEHSLPKSFFNTHNGNDWRKGVYNNDFVYSLRDLSHTKDYLLFNILQGKNSYWVLINRQNNKKVVTFKTLRDDLTYLFPRQHMIYGENKLVAIAEPASLSVYNKLIASWNENPQPKILAKLKELELNVKDSDNPIVIIYDIK